MFYSNLFLTFLITFLLTKGTSRKVSLSKNVIVQKYQSSSKTNLQKHGSFKVLEAEDHDDGEHGWVALYNLEEHDHDHEDEDHHEDEPVEGLRVTDDDGRANHFHVTGECGPLLCELGRLVPVLAIDDALSYIDGAADPR